MIKKTPTLIGVCKKYLYSTFPLTISVLIKNLSILPAISLNCLPSPLLLPLPPVWAQCDGLVMTFWLSWSGGLISDFWPQHSLRRQNRCGPWVGRKALGDTPPLSSLERMEDFSAPLPPPSQDGWDNWCLVLLLSIYCDWLEYLIA